MRAMACSTAVALFLAGPALADGPIATAPSTGSGGAPVDDAGPSAIVVVG